jgi:hypothetical protein
MESKRQSLIKKCIERISEIQFCNKKDKEMLNRIKEQGDTSYVRNQISKTNEKIFLRNEEVKELEEKIKEIPRGEYDDEIQSKIDNNNRIQQEKERAKKEKRTIELQDKKQQATKSQKFYKANVNSDRAEKYLQKDIQRSYNHYIKASNSIPEYILNNLKEMPQNKGYFWKNVACFGELPAEENKPLTLFERQKGGGTLIIHEWLPRYYNIYHKNGKDKKKLVSSTPRKNKTKSIF